MRSANYTRTGSVFKDALGQYKPANFVDAKDYLKAIFAHLKKHLDTYSWRQFAQDLGFGYTNYLHLICNGTRPLAKRAAECIAHALGLRALDRDYFYALSEYSCATKASEREVAFGKMVRIKKELLPVGTDRDIISYMSQWYHPVIREMVMSPHFQPSPFWISEHIMPAITEEEAKASLELLERLGFIRIVSGKYVATQDVIAIEPSSMISYLGALRYQQGMLEMARDSLMTIDEKIREVHTCTVSIGKDDFLQIRAELEGVIQKIVSISDTCPAADRIYQVGVHAFPMALLTELPRDPLPDPLI